MASWPEPLLVVQPPVSVPLGPEPPLASKPQALPDEPQSASP